MVRRTFKTFITDLKKDEVFVFGANSKGFHAAGAAGLAMLGTAKNIWRTSQVFQAALKAPVGSPLKKGKWAVLGIGEGHQVGLEGESYGIVTVVNPGQRRSIPLARIYQQLRKLGAFASKHPEKTFFCAINGGGFNGYSKQEIKTIYERWESGSSPPPENVIFPEEMV